MVPSSEHAGKKMWEYKNWRGESVRFKEFDCLISEFNLVFDQDVYWNKYSMSIRSSKYVMTIELEYIDY